MLEALRELTTRESPSLEKVPTDRCCEFLAELWLQRGAIVEILKQEQRGNHLRIVWNPPAGRAKSQLLVLGHYDTVYPSGTLAKMPFRVAGGKAYGPGTFDMKAGIVQALFALDATARISRAGRKTPGVFVDLRRRDRQRHFPNAHRRRSPAQRCGFRPGARRSAHAAC